MNTKIRTVPDVYVVCKNKQDFTVDILEDPVDIFLNFTNSNNQYDSVSVLPEVGWPFHSRCPKTALLEPLNGVFVALVYPN